MDAPRHTELTPNAVAALASNLVLKAAAGTLYGCNVHATVAGFLMIFDATAKPADGAVTPVKVIAMSAGQSFWYSCGAGPALHFVNGVTLVFSTTGPFTLTASATAFFSGECQ